MLFLVSFALAKEPVISQQVDWHEYNQVTRKLCKTVRTKEEYGATLLAQLIFITNAEIALVSGQMHLSEIRRQVHVSRVASGFSHEVEALKADAIITLSLEALLQELERIEAMKLKMEREMQLNSRSATPRGFPRRVLRDWCNDSFGNTRDYMQHALYVLVSQDTTISTIPLASLFTPLY